MSPPPELPSRRRFLGVAATSAATVGIAACTPSADQPTSAHATSAQPASTHATPTGVASPVPATGVYQAGVITPAPPQPNLVSVVFDLVGDPKTTIAALGRVVLALTAGTDPQLAGLAPGDLTVTVGVGPRLVAAVDPGLPGATALPRFTRERLDEAHSNGDVLVQICSSDPLVLPGCVTAVAAVGGLSERWRQSAFRGPNVTVDRSLSAPRNLLGFVDGIVGPHSSADLASDVWLPAKHRLAGATVAVVRRMEIDLAAFTALDLAGQEAVIGRRRASAAPLSGGTIATDPDLGAKTAAGAYLIPAAAHLRRANPASTGVPPMLRRSYSFNDSVAGLFFVSFQNSLHTFIATLNRMSTLDSLLEYTVTTRSATFLILPGFDARTPLGSQLFG